MPELPRKDRKQEGDYHERYSQTENGTAYPSKRALYSAEKI